MARTLIFYPNCSKGGITSVIRGRAVASPEVEFHFVSIHDRGGREAFRDLANVFVHILQPSRLTKWLNYVLATHHFEEVSILSAPELVQDLKVPAECRLIYEFHSSNLHIIKSELDVLDVNLLDAIRCPSATMANQIGQIADERVMKRLEIVPNKVDTRYFTLDDGIGHKLKFDSTPLLWIGRLDKSKGLPQALRCLALLPEQYTLHAVLSLTDSPDGIANILGEAYSLGVQDRFFIYHNLEQATLADFMRSVAAGGGGLLSTSLYESFGYMYHEATAVGLRVFTFDLPVLHEFPEILANSAIAPTGDVHTLASLINNGRVGKATSRENEQAKSWYSPRWHDFMEKRIRGQEKNVPGFLHNKLKAAKFYEDHDFPSAKILRLFDSPKEIDLSGLTEAFVLKPTAQSSSKGIMVLHPQGSKRYYDSFGRRTLTENEIVEELDQLFKRNKSRNTTLMVEEKITDIGDYEIPRDFKAYGFDGEIGLIQEIDRNTRPTTITWFDGTFCPLREGSIIWNHRYAQEGSSLKPPFAEEMLELARKASLTVPTPFARIDMYLTNDGPVIGEITLTPGGPYYGLHYQFSELIQRKLGQMWADAAQRMAAVQTLESTRPDF